MFGPFGRATPRPNAREGQGGAVGSRCTRYRGDMDPILATRAFIDSRFPLADTAIIGGSTARGERTATSDVDLLIIGPEAMFDGGSDSLAATIRDGAEVFEIFAYTPASFDAWATRSVKRLRPTIVDMLAHGMPLREGADLDALRERCVPRCCGARARRRRWAPPGRSRSVSAPGAAASAETSQSRRRF